MTQEPDGIFRYRVTRTISPRTNDPITLYFEWHGGAYIDVGRVGSGATEVINVYDYAAGKVEIPFTIGALRRKVDEWIKEYGRPALIHDVTKHWR